MQDSSIYDSRREWVSKEEDDKYKFPIVYTIPLKGTRYNYSSKDKGHFNVSKLILAGGCYVTILDLKGKYGMSQFSFGIVDSNENLYKISKALNSNEFKKLKGYFTGSGTDAKNAIIDGIGTMIKFIKEFRKDFWKEFYTKEMEQELIDEGVLNEKGEYIGK